MGFPLLLNHDLLQEIIPFGEMAGEKVLLIEGKVYAALVMADDAWGAKPLFAGMVRLTPKEDGVNWKRLEAAVLLSGYHLFSPIIVKKDQSLPADAVKASFDMWIKDQKTKHESKSKKKLDSVTNLQSTIVSGLAFVKAGGVVRVFSKEAVSRCKLLSTAGSSVSLNALPPLPLDDDLLGGEEAGCVDETEEVLNLGVLGDGSTPNSGKEAPAVSDTLSFVVQKLGMENSVVELVDGSNKDDLDNVDAVGRNMEREEVQLDLDREVEDHLLEADEVSSMGDDSDPVIAKLKASVRRLSGTVSNLAMVNRKQGKMIESLNKLTLKYEADILSSKKSSAEDIASELNPSIKKGMVDIKDIVRKEVRGEVEEIKSAVKECQAALSQELAVIKSSVSFLSSSTSAVKGQLNDLAKLGQSTMGAAMMVNDNLVSSGIVKNDPASQINIPGLLLQINAKLNNANAQQLSSSWTPRHPSRSSSPTLPPKPSRWSASSPSVAGTPDVGPRKMLEKSLPVRNIAGQLNGGQGGAAPRDPKLYNDMLSAQAQMSQAEIDRKLQGYVDTLPGKERLCISDKKRARKD